MTIDVNNVTVIDSNRILRLNSGTTRPGSPVIGMFWFNTSLQQLEVWDGATWRTQKSQPSSASQAWAWGAGSLGDGTTSSRSSPVSVIGGFDDWVQVTTHWTATLGIRANGTLWGWGSSQYGKLGDGTTSTRSSPVSVLGGFTDWIQVSNSNEHGSGIRANGTMWSWGRGFRGLLGDNTTVNKSSPVSVVGGFTDWTQVSCGDLHTLAIRSNGTAWSWGFNNQGQLGDASTSSRQSPVSVVGGFADWVQVSGGGYHSAGIRANGTAWGWGDGNFGQLGNDLNGDRSSPVSVVGGFTDWVQISAGGNLNIGRTAAIRANGTLWTWGNNGSGELGDDTTSVRSSPVSVVGGFTDWVQISAGTFHMTGIRANGTIWTWGNNNYGNLGIDSTISSRTSPGSVSGDQTGWVQVSAKRQNVAIRTG